MPRNFCKIYSGFSQEATTLVTSQLWWTFIIFGKNLRLKKMYPEIFKLSKWSFNSNEFTLCIFYWTELLLLRSRRRFIIDLYKLKNESDTCCQRFKVHCIQKYLKMTHAVKVLTNYFQGISQKSLIPPRFSNWWDFTNVNENK